MRVPMLAFGSAVVPLLLISGDLGAADAPFDEPFPFEIGELFKIKNGKIQQIEALVLNVPYGMPTGWGQKQESKKE